MPPWKSVGLELVPTTLVPYILIFFGKQTLLQAALGALKTLAPEAAECSFFSTSAHVLATCFLLQAVLGEETEPELGVFGPVEACQITSAHEFQSQRVFIFPGSFWGKA